MLPREGEEARHDFRRAFGLTVNRFHRLARFVVERHRRREQELRERHHTGEGVVQFMRDATHQLANGRELLLLQELLRQALLVRDVAQNTEHAHDQRSLEHGRGDHRPLPHVAIDAAIAHGAARPFAGVGLAQQMLCGGAVSRVGEIRKSRPDERVTLASHGLFERPVDCRESTLFIHGENRVRRRFDKPRIARLRALERDGARAGLGDITRHAQHPDDGRSAPDRRIGHGEQALLAVGPPDAALVSNGATIERMLNLLEHDGVVVIDQDTRTVAEQRITRAPRQLAGRLVRGRECSVHVQRVNRVAR